MKKKTPGSSNKRSDDWQPRYQARFNELHRATKPFVSHDDAPLYPPDDAFSKKLKNHSAAVALNYFAYNFLGIHSALRCTRAMAAGVSKKLWGVTDLVALWEADEGRKKKTAA